MSEAENNNMDMNAKSTHTETGPNGEKVEVTETVEIRTSKPGFFGRIARAMRDRPVTTTVGVAGAAGAGAFGTYNYRRYGSILPPAMSPSDVADVARAVSGIFAGR